MMAVITNPNRENQLPTGYGREFIPQRQVEEYPEEEFGQHDDGHHLQSRAVGGRHEEAHDVDIEHHRQENEQPEDDEIFHRLGIGFLVPVACIFVTGKDEGFIGKSEGLCKHHHDNRYLVDGPVYAQLRHGVGAARGQHRIKHLIEGLVHDAGKSQNEQRERILQHARQQLPVEPVTHLENLRKSTSSTTPELMTFDTRI